jgi:hypothetical protein
VCSRSAARFADVEVGCIGVGCKNHVAGAIENAIIWIS